jgi:hypothetical protein
MSGPHETDLSNSCQVAIVAVRLVQERDRIRLGWPRHHPAERKQPSLDFLSPEVREEAERVAVETLADWTSAGKPYLGFNRIKTTYQYLVACPEFRDKYVRSAGDTNTQEQE